MLMVTNGTSHPRNVANDDLVRHIRNKAAFRLMHKPSSWPTCSLRTDR